MTNPLLLIMGSFNRGDVHIGITAAFEDTVGKSVELFFLLVEFTEIEPEEDTTLHDRSATHKLCAKINSQTRIALTMKAMMATVV